MKILNGLVLILSFVLCTTSFADSPNSISNVLIAPEPYETMNNRFMACIGTASLLGSGLRFVSATEAKVLPANSERLAIKTIAQDEKNKVYQFTIVIDTQDKENGWQKISAADKKVYYFSSAVKKLGLVMADGADVASVFSIAACQ